MVVALVFVGRNDTGLLQQVVPHAGAHDAAAVVLDLQKLAKPAAVVIAHSFGVAKRLEEMETHGLRND